MPGREQAVEGLDIQLIILLVNEILPNTVGRICNKICESTVVTLIQRVVYLNI